MSVMNFTGARVILACRDTEKADLAVEFIKQQCTTSTQDQLGELKVVHLDLSSLSSVRKCAEQILKEEKLIHILINNAGIIYYTEQIHFDIYFYKAFGIYIFQFSLSGNICVFK